MSRPTTGRAFLDRADPPGAVLAFAHRGGARHPDLPGLENTLAAFRHAVALGYRYLETDVHLTRDGVLVALHDAVLDRVSDATGGVAELTLAELDRVRVGGREAVPTLAGLVEELPEARFNIDLKSRGAGAALAAFVEERGLHDRVLVGCFDDLRLREFRRRSRGRVATSASPAQVAAYVAPYGSGRALRPLSARLLGDFDALQVPAARGPLRVVTPALLRRAHADGKQVHVWTVDDADEMRRLLDLGVDGIFTDRTDTLKDVLVERGRW